MGSGFIYLVIIGMWAAYFVPLWISRHEETSGKAIERYKNAMQVVAENNKSIKHEIKIEEKNKIFIRRRLIFSSLFSIYFISNIFALLGLLVFTTTLIPLTALLIYFVNVRKQVVASQLRARRLAALEKITNTKLVAIAPTETNRQQKSTEHWIPFAERPEITGVIVVPKDRKGWQPTTVPKPVYTTAPKAIPSKRIIDLTTTGQWSAEQARVKELSGRDDDLFDQSLMPEVIEESRAVND
jgi:type II secretory pathway pseudopilin PulG